MADDPCMSKQSRLGALIPSPVARMALAAVVTLGCTDITPVPQKPDPCAGVAGAASADPACATGGAGGVGGTGGAGGAEGGAGGTAVSLGAALRVVAVPVALAEALRPARAAMSRATFDSAQARCGLAD
jgi:hypothetical protein